MEKKQQGKVNPFLHYKQCRVRKTTMSQALYHALMRHYNKDLESDPLKTKGLIVAFTGKATHISNGVTVHSSFHLPFSSTKMFPLRSNTLDMLTKEYAQLRIFLIDEASLIGSQFLYSIDRGSMKKCTHQQHHS